MDTNSLRAIERVVNMLMAKKGAVEPPRPPISRFLTQNMSKRPAFARALVPFNHGHVAFDFDFWKNIPLPERDYKDSLITTTREKLWAINQMVLKHRHRPNYVCKTLGSFVISTDDVRMPKGAVVFDALKTENQYEAVQQLEKLFALERHNPTVGITYRPYAPGINILFLAARPEDPPIYMPYVLATLKAMPQMQTLHSFILSHVSAIKNTIGASEYDMEGCSLTLVKYDKYCGLIAHIDGIKDFRDTFGPIFTISMGGGYKRLDLLPIATEEDDRSQPVRLISQPFQITMLQGCARAAYAHSVPFDLENERYTIAFKFPEITGGTPDSEYTCSKLDAKIKTIKLRTSDSPQ